MADEAERVGGISVEATISQAGVDAQLEALLGKMQAAAAKMSAALTIQPHVAVPTTASVARQTPQQQPRSVAPPQQTAAQAAALSFGSRAGRSGTEQNSLYRAINEALAKEGKQNEQVIEKVHDTARTKQAEFVQDVHASPAAAPLVLAVSTTEAKEQLTAFLAEFKTEMAAAQESATIKVKVDRPQATQTRGGQDAPRTAPRRKNIDRTQVAADEAEEEQGHIGLQTRMAAYDLREGDRHSARVQQQRRTSAQRAFSESERSRRIELTSQSRQYNTLAALATTYFDDQAARADRAAGISAKADEQRRLTELSYEAQHDERTQPQSTGFAGRQRTPQEIDAFRRTETQRAALLTGGAQQPINLAAEAEARRARSRRLADQRDERRQSAQISRDEVTTQARGTATARGTRGPAVRRTAEDVERRQAERIASSEAQTLTAGRTLRTFESGIGGFLGGGKARVEAQAALAAANEKVRISQDRLREPDVLKSRTATRQATEELTAAENDRAKALERVQSFTGPTAAIRTFAAIGIATVGFSLALKAVDLAMSAVGPALQDMADQAGGFASKSTAVTSALAQQTAAQKGNTDAVLAQQAATAGLSTTATDYLSTQLKLTTQVKAGALAQGQASDLFRASAGANGGAPQGLLGGFGGVLGTSVLAGTVGGGKGFAEQITGDLNAFSEAISKSQAQLPKLFNPKTFLGPLSVSGGGIGAPPQLDKVDLDRLNTTIKSNQEAKDAEVDNFNQAAKRGSEALGQVAGSAYRLGYVNDEVAKDLQTSNLPDELKSLATKSNEALFDSAGNLVKTLSDANKGLEQAAVGLGIPDTATLGRLAQANERQREREAQASVPALQQQFAYERPAFLANLERQQQFQLTTQLPAQAALQNLANPLQPVGTGIIGANADEQAKIEKSTQRTKDLQNQLNAYYAQGEKILTDTYQVPQQLVSSIRAIGAEIASTQAGIRNEQASYQVAQYNYQLIIAKRSLSDIGGLTGKNFGAGQSYLGVLERQNLALSRQGQLLQFNLQQRQINFQQALAGFQAPGVTPEERQANVKEAQIEADFAQKQLDIQRQMFGNQVQIVDIQNLRQGADLARQINLLLQGRQVTIDTAVAEERLIRLNALQQQQVAQAGTYIQKVDAAVGRAFSEIQALETAAGRAMYGAAVTAAGAFNAYLTGVINQLNGYANIASTVAGSDNSGKGQYASGVIGTASGRTDITVGEAGNETVAVIRNPRMADWGSFAGGGGGTVSITFGDVTVRDDSDIDAIARAVIGVIGREGALKGMRAVN